MIPYDSLHSINTSSQWTNKLRSKRQSGTIGTKTACLDSHGTFHKPPCLSLSARLRQVLLDTALSRRQRRSITPLCQRMGKERGRSMLLQLSRDYPALFRGQATCRRHYTPLHLAEEACRGIYYSLGKWSGQSRSSIVRHDY